MKLGNIVNLKTYVIVGLICMALGGASVGVGAWQLTQNYYRAQIEASDANHELALETLRRSTAEKVLGITTEKHKAELSLQEKRDELQTDFDARIGAINSAVADLRNIRLQDPGRTGPTGGSSGSAGTNNPGSTQGGVGSFAGSGVLSEQASQFLYTFGGEADVVLERLRTCQQWDREVREKVADYNARIAELNKKPSDTP